MVAQSDRYFLRDWERWRKDKRFITQHSFDLPPTPQVEPYLFRVGLFNPFTQTRWPVFSENNVPEGNEVYLGLFYAGGQTDPRQPDHTLSYVMGDKIEFLGYTITKIATENAQENRAITLYWQALNLIDEDYTVFVQLLGATNQLITTIDAQPLQGLYPTSRWQKGEIIYDTFTLTWPDVPPSGPYRLITGLYKPTTGERLSISQADGMVKGDFIELVEVDK